VDKFSQYSGVTVAASTDATGHKDKGGDWDLEYLTAPIHYDLAYLQHRYRTYSDVLYDPATYDPATTDTDNDGVMDDIDVDDDNDGILDVDEGVASCDGASNPTYPGGYADLINFEYKQIDDPSRINGTPITAIAKAHPDWHTNTYDDLISSNLVTHAADYNNSGWVTGSSGNASFEPGAGVLNHPLEVYNHILSYNYYMQDNGGFKNVVTGLGDNRAGDQVELFRVTIPYQLAATYTFRAVGSFIWLGSADEDMAIVVNGATILGPFGFNLSGGGAQSVTVTLNAGDVLEYRSRNMDTHGGGTSVSVQAVTGCITSSDFDNDGIPDHLDLDTDNDGIPDNIEAQSTLGYIVPNDDDEATYTTNMGLNSAYLTTSISSGNGLTPHDNDNTDEPDWRDLDSDNTETNDTTEAGLTLSGVDTNFDGIDDAILPPPTPGDIWQSGIVNASTGTTFTSAANLLGYYPSYDGIEMNWRTSLDTDFGDAPDASVGVGNENYRTTVADDGARHGIFTGMPFFLGETAPDNEVDAAQNVAADGDDSVGDDEDTFGVIPLYETSTIFTYNQLVTNNLGTDGYVYAWVDWDNNGVFERDEFVEGGTGLGDVIVVPTGNSNTGVTMQWSTLPILSAGSEYYIRVRLSDEILPDAVVGAIEDPRSYGYGGLGEVEDHTIMVAIEPELPQFLCSVSSQTSTGEGITQLPNYNDDPADGFNGTSVVGDELYSQAGSGPPAKRFELEVLAPGESFTYPISIDVEFRIRNLNDGPAGGAGDGDSLFWLTDHVNMNGVLTGDNALFVGVQALWNGTSPTVASYNQSSVTTMSAAGYVKTTYNRYRIKMAVQSDNSVTMQLIVSDDNGVFIEASPVVSGAYNLDPNNGIYFAHTAHDNDPPEQRHVFGGVSFAASNGNNCDYGDAPDGAYGTMTGNYNTRSDSNGPVHSTHGSIFLGSTPPDADTGAFGDGTDNTGNASDDDNKGTAPDDEDAVNNVPVIYSSDYSVTVACNDFSAGSGDHSATVHAWIDINNNGDFEVSEYASSDCDDTSSTVDGSATLAWSGLTISATADTFMRLRITNTLLTDADNAGSDDRAYGVVANGEVEDHLVQLLHPDDMDGGDAPDNYLVEFSEGGPKHIPSATLYLGANNVDGEVTAASSDATADDATGNDEQGVTLPQLLLDETSYTATAQVFNNTGADATLIAWLDTDKNGTFDASEAIIQTVPSNNILTDYDIVWPSVPAFGYGVYNMRVRLAPVSDGLTTADVGGIATNGEVEDHQLTVYECTVSESPNPVDLTRGFTSNGNIPIDSQIDQGVIMQVSNINAPYTDTGNPIGFLGAPTPVTSTTLWAGGAAMSFTLVYPDGSPRTAMSVGIYGDTYTGGGPISGVALDVNNNVVATGSFGDNGGPFNLTSSSTPIHRVIYTSNSTAINGFSVGLISDCEIAVLRQDFGDAPDIDAGTATGDYQTNSTDGGAAHKKADTNSNNQIDITLGTAWDYDDGNLQGFPATADDLDEGTDDEDGVTLSSAMEPPGGSFDLDIVLTKDAGSTLNGLQLHAWIDW
ncbi:GEVED domain-containing protein, partial [Photobacterium sp. Ph6]|uniref:GEVED domain-containing protein n=1 Tax=Photobacterium sp. Ph6 TaxID=2790954 RepID=UPI001EDEE33B